MVKLDQEIEALDADGTLILDKERKPPKLGEIITYALRAAHPSDQSQGAKEKMERYNILKRMDGAVEIALTEVEKKMVLDRVGKMYLQVELVGKTHEALNPPKEEEQKA